MKSTSYYLVIFILLSLIGMNSVQAESVLDNPPGAGQSNVLNEDEDSELEPSTDSDDINNLPSIMSSYNRESFALNDHLEIITLTSKITSKIFEAIKSKTYKLNLVDNERQLAIFILNGDGWLQQLDQYGTCSNFQEGECSKSKEQELNKIYDRVKKFQDQQVNLFLEEMIDYDKTTVLLSSNPNQLPQKVMYALTAAHFFRYGAIKNILENDKAILQKILDDHSNLKDQTDFKKNDYFINNESIAGYILSAGIIFRGIQKKSKKLKLIGALIASAVAYISANRETPEIKYETKEYHETKIKVEDLNFKLEDIATRMKNLSGIVEFYNAEHNDERQNAPNNHFDIEDPNSTDSKENKTSPLI